jgi:protoheme IX farnesyltransferase
MLPVVAPAAAVTRQILFYSWAMVGASLALIPLGAGVVYTVAAPILGAGFLFEAHRLHRRVRRGEPARPLVVFHASISYLTVLFVAVAVSQFV